MTTNLTAAGPAVHTLAAPAAPAAASSIYSGGVAIGAATAVAVLLAIVLIINIWKKGSPRFNGWLGLAVGLTGASIILSWIGNFATLQIYGVGIMTAIAIGGGFVLWHELVKKRGLHRIRTPLIAIMTGVAFMTVGGVVGTAAQSANHVVTTGVTRVTGQTTGG